MIFRFVITYFLAACIIAAGLAMTAWIRNQRPARLQARERLRRSKLREREAAELADTTGEIADAA